MTNSFAGRYVCAPALLAVSFIAPTAFAQSGEALTFTSGLPPVGDGTVYPRSINPARQGVGGAAIDFFSTSSGTRFSNSNGNPAYFDANNLLTSPASLITNEAFWTDPKLGTFNSSGGDPFELAQFGVAFFASIYQGMDFGFNLAMASVSEDLPTASFGVSTFAYLPFQVQDEDGNSAQGRLVFGDSGDDSLGDIYAEEFGTFQTLSSPRTAYEARFELEQNELWQLIAEENGFADNFDPETDTASPIHHFDIDLAGIATGGGTTQVAMDNFFVGNATLPASELPRETLLYQPQQPVGENTPQYFSLDALSTMIDFGQASDGMRVALSTVLGDVSGLNLGSIISGVTQETAVHLFDTSIDSGFQPGISSLTTTPQSTGGGLIGGIGNILSLLPEETLVGTPIFNAFTDISGQIAVTMSTALSGVLDPSLNQDSYEQIIDRLYADTRRISLQNTVDLNEVMESATGFTRLLHQPEQPLVEGTFDGLASFAVLEADYGSPELFINYTLDQYLALMLAEGSGPRVGDTGGWFEPIFDTSGNIVDLQAHSWLITDESGTFITSVYMSIPEPGMLAIFAAGAGILLVRREHRSAKR